MTTPTESEILCVLHQTGSVEQTILWFSDVQSPVRHWTHEEPKERMATFLKKHPRSHWNIDERPGGSAIMRSIDHSPKTLPGKPGWFEIEVRDHAVDHAMPAAHKDFMVFSVHKPIQYDKVLDVLALSDSVNYERTTQRLSAMCHFMGANVATLYLAFQLADGNMTIEQALKAYGPNIDKTKTDPNAYLDYLNGLGLYGGKAIENVGDPRSLYDGGSEF